MSGDGDPTGTAQPLTRRELRELRERELVAPAPSARACAPELALEIAPAPLAPAAARDAEAEPAVELTAVADFLIAAELHEPDLVHAVLTESDRVIAAPPAEDLASAFELLLTEVPTTTSTDIPLPSRAQLRAQEQEARWLRPRRAEPTAQRAAGPLSHSVPAAPSAPATPSLPTPTPAVFAGATPAAARVQPARVQPARAAARVQPPVRPARAAARVQPAGDRARSAATKSLTVVAMAFVALMAVSTSLPAEALLSSADVQAAAFDARRSATDAPAQMLARVDGTDTITVNRDGYKAQSVAEFAAASGIRMEATFTNNPNGTVQWPFAVGVHIGSKYGFRDCAGCSRNHRGQDFNPGVGAPIQAIADGVVSQAVDGEGSLGVHMMIDHMIDGKLVTSVSAHMIHGSMLFKVGDVVKVGQVIGKTGNTGMSTGPHLHFEIREGGVGGTHVDPLTWLYANTN